MRRGSIGLLIGASFSSFDLYVFYEVMQEIFLSWGKEKYDLSLRNIPLSIGIREIWLVKFGLNIGNEQNGKGDYLRPVLVFKKLRGVFLCIPLTSQGKHPIYHYKLVNSGNRKSYLVFNQVRVLDRRRFVHKMSKISLDDFQIIKKLFHNVLFTEESFGS